jgi:hypothetical protein
MKKSFASRRAPKRIGDDSDSDSSAPSVTVKRPPIVTKSSKRKTAVSRLSFGPGSSDPADTADTSAGEVPKRAGGLGRIALERNAAGKLPFRTGQDAERPSYSAETLRALQESTPSTPKEELSRMGSEEVEEDAMQVVRTDAAAVIPTEAEIREKKMRRARMAKEQEYISLYGEEEDEDGPREVIVRSKDEKYGETRLVQDDEDFAEGFDEYVEDGKISLGRKAEREQQRQKRAEIATLIANAEGSGSDAETDDSEVERNAAYEAAQTRHGTYGRNAPTAEHENRPQVPAKITPVPDLAGVISSLKITLQNAKDVRDATRKKLEDLKTEKVDVAEREVWIQAQLKEMGEKYAHVVNSEVPAKAG